MKPSGWTLAAVGLGLVALAASASAEEAPPVPARPRRPREDVTGPETPPAPTPQPGGSTSVQQPEIITALWAVASEGATEQADSIKQRAHTMTPELQAYLLASARVLHDAYIKDLKFKESFKHEFDEANQEFNDLNNKVAAGLGVAGAVVGTVVPVLGAIIALGAAIYRAIVAGFPPEQRKIEDNINFFKDWEESDCLRGLHLDGNPNPSLNQLKAQIETDLIARRLPAIMRATKFEYTPSIEEYRRAARSLGLYREEYLQAAYGFKSVWNLKPEDEFPTTAYDINNYSVGYSVGKYGGEYVSKDKWGLVGVDDGRAGRESRIGNDLQFWASDYVSP